MKRPSPALASPIKPDRVPENSHQLVERVPRRRVSRHQNPVAARARRRRLGAEVAVAARNAAAARIEPVVWPARSCFAAHVALGRGKPVGRTQPVAVPRPDGPSVHPAELLHGTGAVELRAQLLKVGRTTTRALRLGHPGGRRRRVLMRRLWWL